MARKLLEADQTFTVHEADLDLKIAPDPEATYTLRPLTVELVREVSKRHTTSRFDRSTHQKVDQRDTEAINNDLIDLAIVSWTGVSNGSAQAPCDLAHKLKLPIDVQVALIEVAQVGTTAEVRDASFRESGSVRPVLGG